jgi:hypothetical protein
MATKQIKVVAALNAAQVPIHIVQGCSGEGSAGSMGLQPLLPLATPGKLPLSPSKKFEKKEEGRKG